MMHPHGRLARDEGSSDIVRAVLGVRPHAGRCGDRVTTTPSLPGGIGGTGAF